ncbi:phage holin family protein [Fusobacterium vincentii]|uniref:Phage holin family protein n=1 Tax=Fusobacterium vincentii TaxID=155615 RepID=A0AAJ1FUC4_FUSVC|nr:phage holin family protein [Fusobacterium vincentii]MCW0263044.1 phage holin family protein [Fusobacterium vincentii]STO29876.1 Phage-related holin (Lysis protein) [Fusobacterium vincentii]DAX28587.1 MAG TPA: holin [Caudoviricetes sp.]
MVFLVKLGAYFIAFLIWLIGGWDTLAKVLFGLMFLDYLTGLIVGYKMQNLNSQRAFKGLRKKLLILVILCGASLMHKLVPDLAFRTLVGMFYCATELLSIIENVAKVGVPIPNKLKKALEQLREEKEE